MIQAIMIEAGHGKSWPLNRKDVGAIGRHAGQYFHERDFAKEIAGRVIQILHSKTQELKNCLIQGVGVETDANIVRKMSYVNMVVRENRFLPDNCLHVAIHMNAARDPRARGFEVWYQKANKKSPILSSYLVDSWREYAITPLRPRPSNSSKNGRYGRFYIDDALCPSIIIETGFISNYEDMETIRTHWDRVAEAIAHGVMEYIRHKI